MSLGNYNNYDNNKKEKNDFQPTVYSPYKMSNIEGIDPSALSFSFWAQILKLSIAPANKSNNDTPTFDYKNAGVAYITHTKARILAEEITKFMENPELYNNVGIDIKGGLVSISNGKEFGTKNPCLVIRKIDATTGNVEATYNYEFKTKFHYSIRNFEEKKSKYETVYYENLELEQLKTLLEQYYISMTYATAYSVIDSSKFDNSRINTKIGSIMDKLGIEFRSGGNSGGSSGGGKSFFSGNSGNKNFTSGTIDDISEEIEDIE